MITGVAAALAAVVLLCMVSGGQREVPGSLVSVPPVVRGEVGIHTTPREPLVSAVGHDAQPGTSRKREGFQFGRVDLRVLDDADATPVIGFAWSISGTSLPEAAETVGTLARLTVPLGEPAAVHVSAEGYAGSLPVDVSLRDGALYRTVEVRLVPMRTEAMVLTVCDVGGQPVSRLRITCATPDAEAGASAYRTLWTRVSTARDGIHRVAGVPTGRYRLRLVALSAEGRPRTLLPIDRLVWGDGGSGAAARVVMQPGGSIAIAREETVMVPLTVRLEGPGTQSRRHRWVGVAAAAVSCNPPWDTLPALPLSELYEPVPAGEYTLSIFGAVEMRRTVTVAPGRVTRLTIR